METKLRSFEENLKYGKEFEDSFSRRMMNKGWHVIPKYLFCEEGAPSMFGLNSKYAVPDIDAAKDGKRIWVECKRKNVMQYHPATGYPVSNHDSYKKIKKITGTDVWIVFEDESLGKMYGNEISILEENIYRIMKIQGKEHILFNYPQAFIEL